MYLGHWSLERPPFENLPDSRFLFPTEQHVEALATITYAVCERREPTLLVGPPGCGKTLILRSLRRRLPRDRYRVAFVPNVAHARIGLLERVAYHLGERDPHPAGSSEPANAAAAASRAGYSIMQHLQAAEAGAQTIVAMLDDWPDEANERSLEELRWLLDLDVENSRVCAIISGNRVDAARNWPPGLSQRLFAAARVEPLETEQVVEYLAHRMRTAGASNDEIFAPSAAARIAEWSGGVPRLVNRIADVSLSIAYLELAERVEIESVQTASDRLGRFTMATEPELAEATA